LLRWKVKKRRLGSAAPWDAWADPFWNGSSRGGGNPKPLGKKRARAECRPPTGGNGAEGGLPRVFGGRESKKKGGGWGWGPSEGVGGMVGGARQNRFALGQTGGLGTGRGHI